MAAHSPAPSLPVAHSRPKCPMAAASTTSCCSTAPVARAASNCSRCFGKPSLISAATCVVTTSRSGKRTSKSTRPIRRKLMRTELSKTIARGCARGPDILQAGSYGGGPTISGSGAHALNVQSAASDSLQGALVWRDARIRCLSLRSSPRLEPAAYRRGAPAPSPTQATCRGRSPRGGRLRWPVEPPAREALVMAPVPADPHRPF